MAIAPTIAVVAVTRLSTSSRFRAAVHGQSPMFAPARLTTPAAPSSALTQSAERS